MRFSLDESGVLAFENPSVRAQFTPPPAKGYRAQWFRFDNTSHDSQPIGTATTSANERMQGPADLPRADGAYIRVSISAVESPLAAWTRPVEVYFRRAGGRWQLVGIERTL